MAGGNALEAVCDRRATAILFLTEHGKEVKHQGSRITLLWFTAHSLRGPELLRSRTMFSKRGNELKKLQSLASECRSMTSRRRDLLSAG